MYKIEEESFGYLITFSGIIGHVELNQWYQDSQQRLLTAPEKFGVLVNMEGMSPLAPHNLELMINGQKLYRQKGMQRSAVILGSALLTEQFRRLAIQSGIYKYERYFDAESTLDWEKLASDWVINGIDPDN